MTGKVLTKKGTEEECSKLYKCKVCGRKMQEEAIKYHFEMHMNILLKENVWDYVEDA